MGSCFRIGHRANTCRRTSPRKHRWRSILPGPSTYRSFRHTCCNRHCRSGRKSTVGKSPRCRRRRTARCCCTRGCSPPRTGRQCIRCSCRPDRSRTSCCKPLRRPRAQCTCCRYKSRTRIHSRRPGGSSSHTRRGTSCQPRKLQLPWQSPFAVHVFPHDHSPHLSW